MITASKLCNSVVSYFYGSIKDGGKGGVLRRINLRGTLKYTNATIRLGAQISLLDRCPGSPNGVKAETEHRLETLPLPRADHHSRLVLTQDRGSYLLVDVGHVPFSSAAARIERGQLACASSAAKVPSIPLQYLYLPRSLISYREQHSRFDRPVNRRAARRSSTGLELTVNSIIERYSNYTPVSRLLYPPNSLHKIGTRARNRLQ